MTTPTPAQIQARRATFRQLHASGCFAIPNPWDLGSARYLAHLGFKALASTSSGCAWAHGTFDGGMALDAVLAHLRDMVAATDLPINADFENGFARSPQEVARHVRQAIDTSIAGVSIEDSTGQPDAPLFDITLGAERMRAAREAIDASGQDVMLIGRAENFFVGRPDIDDAIARLRLLRRRRRLPVRASDPHTRADRRRGGRLRAQAGQRAHWRPQRLHHG